jgi:20S proteasome alpha/beta subunit
MTTIAYKDGIIAYDSRAVKGDVIMDDDFDKCEEYNNHYFFYTGDPCDIDMLIHKYFGEEINKEEINCEVIVVDSDNNI